MNRTEPVEIAHLLKRTSFGVTLARVTELAQLEWEEAIALVVDRAEPPAITSEPPFRNIYLAPDEDDYYDQDFYLLLDYELSRLGQPQTGLGDRMLWFWHGILTSGYSEVDVADLLFRQHKLLARHALGNFRRLLVELTTDPAMLTYLSGDGSTGDSPNENYARELLELFTLGRGKYRQADITAAAKALSGWYLRRYPKRPGPFDPKEIVVRFDPESSYDRPVTFLEVTAKHTVTSIIDRILAQDACAEYIAERLFRYFIHPNPDRQSVAALGRVFRNADYEIKPLLMALFRHPDFRHPKSRAARARLPLETLLATAAAFSTSVFGVDYRTYIDATGQWPFDPPNVAGWPLDNRWVSAPHALARIRLGMTAYNLPPRNPAVKAVAEAEDPVTEALGRASLYDVSGTTRNELDQVAKSIKDSTLQAQTLLALAVASPEFAVV